MWENDLLWKWGEYTSIIIYVIPDGCVLTYADDHKLDDQNKATYISERHDYFVKRLICSSPHLCFTCTEHHLF